MNAVDTRSARLDMLLERSSGQVTLAEYLQMDAAMVMALALREAPETKRVTFGASVTTGELLAGMYATMERLYGEEVQS